MTSTEKHRLNRAETKLGIPAEALDEQVVNLQFSNSNSKKVYSILLSFANLYRKLKATNRTLDDVMNWLDTQHNHNKLDSPLQTVDNSPTTN